MEDNDQIKRLLSIFMQFIKDKFYGEVSIKLESGKIVHCVVSKSIKL
jgi:hypothetical protein